jgi:hypothetical protein
MLARLVPGSVVCKGVVDAAFTSTHVGAPACREACTRPCSQLPCSRSACTACYRIGPAAAAAAAAATAAAQALKARPWAPACASEEAGSWWGHCSISRCTPQTCRSIRQGCQASKQHLQCQGGQCRYRQWKREGWSSCRCEWQAPCWVSGCASSQSRTGTSSACDRYRPHRLTGEMPHMVTVTVLH